MSKPGSSSWKQITNRWNVFWGKTSKPSAQIEWRVLHLQDYDYQVIYRPRKTNIADALSRLNRNSQDTCGDQVDYVWFVALHATPEAITTKMVERASMEDLELQNVCQCIQSGQWDNCQNKSYIAVSAELCTIGQLVLHENRIIIPEKLRLKVVAFAHEGQFGRVETKQRLRSKVWWPKMEWDAERHCRTCHGCQLVSRQNPPEPIRSSEMPQGRWQSLAMDFIGSLLSGDSVLVVVDYSTHEDHHQWENYWSPEGNLCATWSSYQCVQWQWPSVYLKCLCGIHAEYGHRTLSLPAIVAAG